MKARKTQGEINDKANQILVRGFSALNFNLL